MLEKRANVLLMVALLALFLIVLRSTVMAEQSGAEAEIANSQRRIVTCYDAAKEAEAAGANITLLNAALNEAGSLLSRAEFAFSNGDVASAQDFAVQSQGKLVNFVSDADALLVAGAAQRNQDFLMTMVGWIGGAVAVLVGSVGLWSFLKTKYNKTENKRPDLKRHKAAFLVVTIILTLLVASPVLQRVLVFPRTESFTELWLLGPEHSAENFPSNITNNGNYSVFLGVANHLGSCAYYVVEVKFRNQTQSAPDSFNRTHSSLESLYSVNAFLADNASWELPITFSFAYSYDAAASKVDFGRLQFNDMALNLNGYSTSWDQDRNVFFGDLVFELWLYNSTIDGFQYHERHVDLKFDFVV